MGDKFFDGLGALVNGVVKAVEPHSKPGIVVRPIVPTTTSQTLPNVSLGRIETVAPPLANATLYRYHGSFIRISKRVTDKAFTCAIEFTLSDNSVVVFPYVGAGDLIKLNYIAFKVYSSRPDGNALSTDGGCVLFYGNNLDFAEHTESDVSLNRQPLVASGIFTVSANIPPDYTMLQNGQGIWNQSGKRILLRVKPVGGNGGTFSVYPCIVPQLAILDASNANAPGFAWYNSQEDGIANYPPYTAFVDWVDGATGDVSYPPVIDSMKVDCVGPSGTFLSHPHFVTWDFDGLGGLVFPFIKNGTETATLYNIRAFVY